MKTNEIRKDVLNYIAQEIEVMVSRIGIETKIEFLEAQESNDICLKSSPFKMTPAIFKEVHLLGHTWVIEEEDKDYTVFNVRIEYSYQHWTGGYNGCKLGNVKFAIRNSVQECGDEEISSQDMEYYVNKLHGIEL